MRNMKKIVFAALAIMTAAAVAGCSGGSSAPNVELATVAAAEQTVEDDGTEAAIELLSLDNPIDFSYSYYDTDLIFEYKDGKWVDSMVEGTPINQELMNSMTENFLHLKAVSKVENPKTLEEYHMDYPMYSLYITDSQKGGVSILIGDQDENGNYYATLDEENFYILKKSTVESLIVEFDDLVVKDTLDITVAPEDIHKASVTAGGKTTTYKSSDTEAMTRISNALSNLKPDQYADYCASESALANCELDEDSRITFTAEADINGETRTVTVYVGIGADAEGKYHYAQLEGSNMICYVETSLLEELLNGESLLGEAE